MNDAPRYFALVPAAGSGVRMGVGVPKQYLPLLGVPMLHHTLAALCAVPAIERVYVVLSPHDTEWARHNWHAFGDRLKPLFHGGATRADSVRGGLRAIEGDVSGSDWILVHDAARPCVTRQLVEKLMHELAHDDVGGLLATPAADTLKRADGNADAPRIAATVPRENLWHAQTPQMFRYQTLRRALEAAPHVTDEAAAIEAAGLRPRLIEGEATNLKITRPFDTLLAEWVLRSQSDNGGGTTSGEKNIVKAGIRVGQGFDVHPFVEGRPLMLGGVDIPFPKGLLGHSDADVLLHAIADALLGAAGLGDIGRHFPDNDSRYKGADSRVLLRAVYARVWEAGWNICNVDATLICQEPKVQPYAARMSANIADDLNIEADAVNIKGKTTEKLGFTGRNEGIAAQAAVLLARRIA